MKGLPTILPHPLKRLSRRWRTAAWLLLVVLLVVSPLALSRGDKNGHRRGQELDEAVRSVKNQTRGQILSAKTHQDSQRRYHKIRVLTPDGRVKNVRLPADRSGKARPDQRRVPPPRDRDDEWQP